MSSGRVSRRILTLKLQHSLQLTRQTAVLAGINSTESDHGEQKCFQDMPGPSASLPLIGGLIHHMPFGDFYKKTPPQIYEICRKKYGNVYKEKILHFSLVNVFDPDDFEVVLRSDGKYPVREAFLTLAHYNKKYNNDVQGILTSQNKTWYDLRSKFQQKMLRPQAATAYFEDHAKIADELLEKIALSRDENGIIEDMRIDLNKYATDCIAYVCFNRKFQLLLAKEENIEAKKLYEAVCVIMDICHHEFKRLPLYKLFETSSFKEFVKAQNYIKEISLKYCKEVLQRIEEAEKCGKSIENEDTGLIPYLLSKTSLSEEEIFNVISEMLFAGIDTTSNHISYMLYLLGTHPEIQDTLYKEIYNTIGNKPLCVNDISQMSYLKAVDKEVHRVLPVALGTIRTLQQDIQLKGYNIPKGTAVALHWGSSATDEKQFKDSKLFKPERWLRCNDERKEIHPYASIPFGVGQRSCIGRRFAEQESFLVVVKILQNYEVKYVGGDLTFDYGVSVAPANKMRFRFIPRNP